jgi:hypothetical protein
MKLHTKLPWLVGTGSLTTSSFHAALSLCVTPSIRVMHLLSLRLHPEMLRFVCSSSSIFLPASTFHCLLPRRSNFFIIFSFHFVAIVLAADKDGHVVD